MSLSISAALTRVRTVPCGECLRAIRWWNRRVWLVDSERYVHLQCWEGQLFFKALMADQIRSMQIMADKNSALSRNQSPENELQKLHTCAAQQEQVERPAILLSPADELATKPGVDDTQRHGNSSLRESREGLWHFLGRFTAHRPPRPSGLCMLCGAVEFNEKSVLCSKCGTPLQPST